jgi:hypothetical protein
MMPAVQIEDGDAYDGATKVGPMSRELAAQMMRVAEQDNGIPTPLAMPVAPAVEPVAESGVHASQVEHDDEEVNFLPTTIREAPSGVRLADPKEPEESFAVSWSEPPACPVWLASYTQATLRPARDRQLWVRVALGGGLFTVVAGILVWWLFRLG